MGRRSSPDSHVRVYMLSSKNLTVTFYLLAVNGVTFSQAYSTLSIGRPQDVQKVKPHTLLEIHAALYIFTARSTLCVIAVLLSAGVRPSVRATVTSVYCTQTAKDIIKLISRTGSPIIPVFHPKRRRYPIPRGRKIHGGGKTAIFL